MNVLKVAANSVKKEHRLPDVALDLLRLALKESKFELFWKEVVEGGLLKSPSWTTRFVCVTLVSPLLQPGWDLFWPLTRLHPNPP